MLELATLEMVDWFNTRCLFEDRGRIAPAEFEDRYYRQSVSAEPGETHTCETARLVRARRTRLQLLSPIEMLRA
jgi:hypothetical protein